MDAYSKDIQAKMVKFSHLLNERDRRWYAAVEAEKLGHGGIEYISNLLDCDPKTIRRGISELELEQPLDTKRQRKKGGDVFD